MTELLESQLKKTHRISIIKKYKAAKNSVNRLYEICPQCFENKPSLVGFRAETFSPTHNTVNPSNWGFLEPLNMDVETFIKKYINKNTKTIDLSALVVGAKKNTFVFYPRIRESPPKEDAETIRKRKSMKLEHPLASLRKLRTVVKRAMTQKGFEDFGWSWIDRSTSPAKSYNFNSSKEVLSLYKEKKEALKKLTSGGKK